MRKSNFENKLKKGYKNIRTSLCNITRNNLTATYFEVRRRFIAESESGAEFK